MPFPSSSILSINASLIPTSTPPSMRETQHQADDFSPASIAKTMHALDEATVILAIDPYDLILGRSSLPINNDKDQAGTVSRSFNWRYSMVMHNQTVFHQLRPLMGQLSNEALAWIYPLKLSSSSKSSVTTIPQYSTPIVIIMVEYLL